MTIKTEDEIYEAFCRQELAAQRLVILPTEAAAREYSQSRLHPIFSDNKIRRWIKASLEYHRFRIRVRWQEFKHEITITPLYKKIDALLTRALEAIRKS